MLVGMYSAYWQYVSHYDLPACFSCSIISFDGSEFFSCVSVFNSDLSNFSIIAIGFVRYGYRASRTRWREGVSLICSVVVTELHIFFLIHAFSYRGLIQGPHCSQRLLLCSCILGYLPLNMRF